MGQGKISALEGFYIPEHQGEYAGLMVIRKYFEERGETERRVVLIPSSAHGTSPASARMAGMDVVVVKCRKNGDVDIDDLRKCCLKNEGKVACLMITYPSTHGVFESGISEMLSSSPSTILIPRGSARVLRRSMVWGKHLRETKNPSASAFSRFAPLSL